MKFKRSAAVACAAAVSAAFGLGLAGCKNELPKTAEEYDAALRVNVNESALFDISPMIYGQFIEHIETCIYNGIWAEMILDRKFYYEAGREGLSPWTVTGGAESVKESYVDEYAVQISAGGALSQKNIPLSGNCTGYVYASSAQGAKASVTLSCGAFSQSVSIDVGAGGWKKYGFSFDYSGAPSEKAEFTLAVTSGTAVFDAFSLMPADNVRGMRKDTLDLLKELNSPLYRWPGGNFLSGYDWKDGVGDRDRRPSRRNLHYMKPESAFASEAEMIASDTMRLAYLGFYGGIEPNDYGADEFLYMCEYLGAEPLMMVNDGLGSVKDAADLVEYCNGSKHTVCGNKRAENGREQPYAITYWGVGNEMFGDWQLGNVPVSEYVVRHNEFSKAMKAKDASIKIIGVGNNASDWDGYMFKNCAENLDMIAEHFYGKQNDSSATEHIDSIKRNVEDRIGRHRALTKEYPALKNLKIAFTEYAYDEAKTASRLKDGMGIAAVLNSVITNADAVDIACYSSTVNATQGCITTTGTSATMQGAGRVLKLYRDNMQAKSLNIAAQKTADLPLDFSASVSADGKTVSVAVVNPTDSAVLLDWARLNDSKHITRHTVSADYFDSDGDELFCESAERLSNAVAPAMSVSVFVVKF